MKRTNIISLFILMLCTSIRPPAIYLIIRNMFSYNVDNVIPKYKCDTLNDVTVIVSIKDTCSQTPAFLNALQTITSKFTPIIFTYPNSTYCRHWHINALSHWSNVIILPLDSESAPMTGWIKAIPYINTNYSYLVHNDGYALDDSFLCELKNALVYSDSSFIIAAPMLYENDNNGNLMAHATQESLQIQSSSNKYGSTMFHEHSLYRALNRGADIKESEQTEFLEDHGFLIKTNYITKVVDPKASFTLEYLDMILNIRYIGKKVIFVPSARLEFRVTSFMWRDIPHFAYKRSEEIAHTTINYISNKWMVGVPNTGFWTYIKYTILEQHTFTDIVNINQLDQLRIYLSFFHIAGFNRYSWNENNNITLPVALNLLKDNQSIRFQLVRNINAKQYIQEPVYNASRLVKSGVSTLIELHYDYNPFMIVKFEYKCTDYNDLFRNTCNMILKHNGNCECWLNIPVFKQLGISATIIKNVLRTIKIPERVVTYFEMVLYRKYKVSSISNYKIRQNKKIKIKTYACEANRACSIKLNYDSHYRIVRFYGGAVNLPTLQKLIANLK